MSAAFYAYVRGQTDALPDGYTEAGMRAYRYLVRLGASQMVEAHFPQLRPSLGEDDWNALIAEFVRQSAWTSHFYGDLKDEFVTFLARASAESTA